MIAGSVVVNDAGVASPKTGLAGAIYDEFVDNYTADVLATTGIPGEQLPSGAYGAPIKRGFALQANHLATAIVTYVTANAEAVIPATAAGDGLQRTPNPNNPDTPTQRPSSQKTLSIQ